MLRLRGTFDGEYLNFDLVASMARLQQILGAHLEQRYPGECVTVTVSLHPEARGRVSRRHEEYVFAAVWEGREWIVWEAPPVGAPQADPPPDAPAPPADEEDRHARARLHLRA